MDSKGSLNNTILKVEGLRTYFSAHSGVVKAVDNISFELTKGKVIGIVGESGSGKSVSMLSVLGLIEPPGEVLEGSAIFSEQNSSIDLLKLSEKEIVKYRGSKIGMIYQHAISAFNPIQKIRKQLAEAINIHQSIRQNIDKKLKDLLLQVDLEDPQRILDAYPHQLSGGQLQRCMIAMAIANQPVLLIADEPTTALDVITQRNIIDLLQRLKRELNLSMVFISHDLSVIAEMADHTIVMRDGKIVEFNTTEILFKNPAIAYTKALLHARPSTKYKTHRLPELKDFEQLDATDLVLENISKQEIDKRRAALDEAPVILKVSNLSKTFAHAISLWGKSKSQIKAVDLVSFQLRQGEVLGVAGQSGSGKSTLAKLILNLTDADQGSVTYNKVELLALSQKAIRPLRKELQIIFQDVYGSLDPRMSVEKALKIVIDLHFSKLTKIEKENKINQLLKDVGLTKNHLQRLPHDLSGGERQRVCIARALALEPKLLICDECVSALDVSVQAQILNLLLDLRDKYGLSILFISHNLSVLNFISDRILIMHQGRIIEEGYPEKILQAPVESYTKSLIQALPNADF